MPQGAKCGLFLYADDTCITSKHGNILDIEDQLNLSFSSLCDWFIENKSKLMNHDKSSVM